MTLARELAIVSPRHAVWHAFDTEAKVELFSTAVTAPEAVLVVDPIPMSKHVRTELDLLGRVSAVLVTNENHNRAAAQFAEHYCCRIITPAQLVSGSAGSREVTDSLPVEGLLAFRVEGAAPGEVAFYDEADGGSLLVGDALINFYPYEFDLLPARYCTNRKRMIGSLRRLLDLQFRRMFFAHGEPIVAAARERLTALLASV